WREKQKSSRGIRRGQGYRLVFQFPIREPEKKS
ncbi:transcriptional regulator, partial [Shigella boydii]|nr:transcriptional regulator [Shigella boydii]